jgi:hypothetical protein
MFRCRTACRLLPYALVHVIRKPFRTAPAASTVRLDNPEYRRATHDIYCAMFLRGYRRVTGYPVDPATGLVLVLFAVFIYTFDHQFERARRAGATADFQSILDRPSVAEVWAALAGYLHAHRRGRTILDHLLATFAAHYDSYHRLVLGARDRTDYAAGVALVEYDSGLALQTMYELVRLFNSHPFHAECARQFFAIGMAGKYVDDFADVAADHEAGNPNLMRALVAAYDKEEVVLRRSLAVADQLDLRWWRTHCPVSLQTYFGDAFSHYDRIADPVLRLPVDVYLLLLHSRRFWRGERRRSPLGEG